ncbi:rho GDP-dissociation inhibitor 1-like [Saccoglossus kowalevskii]|uniref:Rho GDP-dissociation inhibitor 1-like n=1 Tax=Saccoglossus kowalevskii TaxID=10224 RepID=A0ABM0GK57_SACKO|nr:PREDICTED: rho GDP-dissociation inhibitor 1-like [Saccoglossus kowalevskii]
MASDPQEISPHAEEEIEETPGYKPPAEKSLAEIQQLDDEDESLKKYKETLLGTNLATGIDDPRKVIVEKMCLVVEGRPDVELALTGDLSVLKSSPFVIKEGTEYRIKILFRIQHEIVCGLKYHQLTYRKGIRVDKTHFMVGSYGPKAELQFYQTPAEEAPKGMVARGHYTVKSKFIDDDKNDHLSWEWAFDIKKDWQ